MSLDILFGSKWGMNDDSMGDTAVRSRLKVIACPKDDNKRQGLSDRCFADIGSMKGLKGSSFRSCYFHSEQVLNGIYYGILCSGYRDSLLSMYSRSTQITADMQMTCDLPPAKENCISRCVYMASTLSINTRVVESGCRY